MRRTLQAPLGRRDSADQTEHVWVWFDTFFDRRTAVAFGVTASGVRLDRFHSSDNEESFDSGFDPVWEARTTTTADGWSAELWIPFSQLRFNRQNDLVWGVNIQRFRPTLDEEDYWVLVPRTERVFVSRFGDLRGIAGVRPTRRIELLPVRGGCRDAARRPRHQKPVRRRPEPFQPRRRRRQDGPRTQRDARGHHQSRLRAGRSRSGGSEPHRHRNALRRAAAVLSRRRADLHRQPPELLLLATDRRAARRARPRPISWTIRRTPRFSPPAS